MDTKGGNRWVGGGGGVINWEFGINIHTLLYIKEINNKDILYSARNTAEYSVIT